MPSILESFVANSAAEIFQDSGIMLTNEEVQKICGVMSITMGDCFDDIVKAPSCEGRRMEFSGLTEEGLAVYQPLQPCSSSS